MEHEIDKKNTIDTKLELIKHLGEVQSSINQEITSDFVYSILDEKERKLVIEMVHLAYYGKRVLDKLALTATRWVYDHEKRVWQKVLLDIDGQLAIREISKTMFDAFMTRLYVISILSRNNEKNALLRWSIQVQEQSDDEDQKDDKKETSKIVKLLQKRQEGE